jgi:hypothetical protein
VDTAAVKHSPWVAPEKRWWVHRRSSPVPLFRLGEFNNLIGSFRPHHAAMAYGWAFPGLTKVAANDCFHCKGLTDQLALK